MEEKIINQIVMVTVHLAGTIFSLGMLMPSMISSSDDKTVIMGFLMLPITVIFNYLIYQSITKGLFTND